LKKKEEEEKKVFKKIWSTQNTVKNNNPHPKNLFKKPALKFKSARNTVLRIVQFNYRLFVGMQNGLHAIYIRNKSAISANFSSEFRSHNNVTSRNPNTHWRNMYTFLQIKDSLLDFGAFIERPSFMAAGRGDTNQTRSGGFLRNNFSNSVSSESF